MYILLYSVVLLNIILITKIKYKTIIKSNVLFTGMWCVCAGLSSLGLYELYKPSPIIHFFSLTAILTFNVVFLLHNNVMSNSIDFMKLKGSTRLKVIVLANLIAWIYSTPFLIKSINIIATQGFKVLRAYAFDASMGLGTTLQLLILQWVVYAIFITTILIAMVYTAIGKKSPILISIALIDVIIYTLIFGGRYLIVRMMMYYILAYLIMKSSNLKNLQKKKLNIFFIGLIIIIVVVLTSQRDWGKTSFIENTIVYYIGSFSFLDVVLNTSYFNQELIPLFGMGIFGFVVNLLIAPFTFLLGIPYNGSDALITQVTAVSRYISPTQSYNAMTTMLYPFLRDMGYLGILFGTAFLSWFVSVSEKMLRKTKQIRFLCLYVYLAFFLFDSVMSYQLLLPSSGITLVLLFLFVNSKSHSDEI
ncbi:O-antigen polymerase [Bacillus thuringiensis]|uniref:O-antigen polymerase n=1 Tax=Bacillus thuringiensis TaxID=1428 RepID=UPI003A80EA2E